MLLINDIKPRAFRSIPIKVYEEIKVSVTDNTDLSVRAMSQLIVPSQFSDIQWIEGTPYSVSVV